MSKHVPTDLNERFLRMLFGADQVLFGANWENATVVSVPVLGPGVPWTAHRAGSGVLKHFDPKANNYYAVSLFNDPLLRRKENFLALCVLAVDDVGTKVNPDRLRATLGEPTYRIETSPGSEHWGYRLEPRVTDLTRAARLIKRVVVGLAGGKDPGMEGVTRVMRLPEGSNTKSELNLGPRGWACVLQAGANVAPPLDPALAEEKLPLPEDKISSGGPGAGGDPDGLLVLDPGPGPGTVTDPVARGLWRLNRIKSASRTLAGGVGWDVVCPWVEDHTPTGAVDTGTVYFRGGGFKCWHGHCDNRGPAEVRARVDELLRADSGGLVGLQDLEPASGRLDAVDPSRVPPSPVQATPEPDIVRRFWAETVLHAQEDRFVSLRTGSTLSDGMFNTLWLPELRDLNVLPPDAKGNPVSPARWYRGSPRHRLIDTRTWWPGRGELFSDLLEGKRVNFLNTWVDIPRPLIQVPDADLQVLVGNSPWAELVRKLFDAATARHWLNYQSMVLAAVDIKPGHISLTMGKQGVGKEIILVPVIRTLGDRALQIDQGDLNGNFTDWLKRKLVVLPEVRRTTRGTTTDHDQYQRIKALCDPGKIFVRLNEKYLRPTQVRNVFVLVMTSNEDKPMTLPADDRRIWVIEARDPGWDPADYQDLVAWYDEPTPWVPGADNALALGEWLIRRWDPKTMLARVLAPAPMTPAKESLIGLGRNDIQVWVEELLTRATPDPLALHDAFTASDVMARIDSAGQTGVDGLPRGTRSPGITTAGRMLGALGCVKLNGGQPVPMPSGPMKRLWAKPGDQVFVAMGERELAGWLAANRRP